MSVRSSAWIVVPAALIAGLTVPSLAQAITFEEVKAKRDEITQCIKGGKYRDAEKLCKETILALENDNQLKPTDRRSYTGYFLSVRGDVSLALGRLDDAETHWQECLTIRRGSPGPQNRDVGAALNNLGKLRRLQDRYGEAETFYSEASEKLRGAGEKHSEFATSLLGQGKVFELMGQFAKAEASYKEAKGVAENNKDSANFATACNNLAWLHHTQKKYDQVLPLLETALDLRRAIAKRADSTAPPDKHPDVAEVFNNIGLHYYVKEDFARARTYLEAAVAGKADNKQVNYRLNLADLNRSQKRFREAEDQYKECIREVKKLRGDLHPDTAVFHLRLAWLYAETNRVELAAKEATIARQGLREHGRRVLGAQSENQQLEFLRNKDQDWFHAALTMALKDPDNETVARLTAEWVLNAKGVTLPILAERRLVDVTGNRDAARLKADLRKERARLVELQFEDDGPAKTKEGKEAVAKEERLSRELGRLVPAKDTRWVEVDSVRDKLKQDDKNRKEADKKRIEADQNLTEANKAAERKRIEADDSVLIEIVRYRKAKLEPGKDWDFDEDRYAAWVIPPAGVGRVKVFDLGRADDLDKQVAKARELIENAITRPGGPPGLIDTLKIGKAETGVRDQLGAVGKILQPVLNEVAASPRWVISPDSSLWLMPWAALPDGKGYAIEKHVISFLHSGRDLMRPPTKVDVGQPAIFADIDYGNGKARYGALKESIKEAGLIDTELRKMKKDGQPVVPTVLTREAATKKALMDVRSPRYLVLSTHGFFDVRLQKGAAADNPLLCCGLALAGASGDREPGSKAGVALGQELLELELRGTELVLLSACQTNVGQVRNGESVASLQHAFHLAGAEAVVGTLWEVPDKETALIAAFLFNNLAQNKDKATALAEAVRTRIARQRKDFGAAHPVLWAGLCLTGR